MMRTSLRCLSILAFAVAACGGPDPDAGTGDAATGDAATGDSAAATSDAGVAGVSAPADSVVAWATGIRDGVRGLPARVGTDPDGARQRAVELYITRQERIEQAAGPGTGSPAELAESVHEAEARFHELMQLLGESPPPDSSAVAAAVGALDARLAEVVELAGAGAETGGTP